MAGGEPELETVRKGTPLYGQPAWWGDEDTGKMKNGDDNMQATQGKSLDSILQYFVWPIKYTWFLLTHWGRDKMAAISQTTLSNAFSWMKMFEFRLKFHWSLFLRVQLTIFKHWFR